MSESVSERGLEAAGRFLKVFFFDIYVITQFAKYPEK